MKVLSESSPAERLHPGSAPERFLHTSSVFCVSLCFFVFSCVEFLNIHGVSPPPLHGAAKKKEGKEDTILEL